MTPDLRSVPAPQPPAQRSAPAPPVYAVPAHRSALAHLIFGPLRSAPAPILLSMHHSSAPLPQCRQNYVVLLRRVASNSQHSPIGDQTGPAVTRRFHGLDESGLRKFDTHWPVKPAERSTPVCSTCGYTTYLLG